MKKKTKNEFCPDICPRPEHWPEHFPRPPKYCKYCGKKLKDGLCPKCDKSPTPPKFPDYKVPPLC